ncbi:hypothetical protein [Aromatoleum evansii]|uniref:hypothetical protein n=1 Tax=Aromatoleum evansii TaxID=59406 RepID=UPI00145D9750|nr:hypothetical protein [Aromatoleum evansii]NMG28431.1 hypothetical protein [Aromatoleum evansii]
MQSTSRLGAAISAALAAGLPPSLVAAVLTIQHRGRLRRLFRLFAARFLESVVEVRISPASRHAATRRVRAKATVDLVRARLGALGQARPTDQDMLEWAREADLPRIVPLHRAA